MKTRCVAAYNDDTEEMVVSGKTLENFLAEYKSWMLKKSLWKDFDKKMYWKKKDEGWKISLRILHWDESFSH